MDSPKTSFNWLIANQHAHTSIRQLIRTASMFFQGAINDLSKNAFKFKSFFHNHLLFRSPINSIESHVIMQQNDCANKKIIDTLYYLFFLSAKTCCAIILAFIININPASAFSWGPYRGFNTHPDITEQDLIELASTGANLIRLSFNKHPLMKKDPPYDFDEEAFNKLSRIINSARRLKLKIVIDPHTTPGTVRNTTTAPSDALWQNILYHDLLVKLWDRIAYQYKENNDVIVGYDLLNEPSARRLPFTDGAADYNALISRLILTIRKHDSKTPIIIEPPAGRTLLGILKNRFDGIEYLTPPENNQIIYSPHMYQPLELTHQGIRDRPTGITYPGWIGGQYWDKETLRKVMEPAIRWQKQYGASIYIGEFSVVRWSGESGERYLNDLLSIFDEYGWSWTYHSWRESPAWDAEIQSYSIDDKQRSKEPSRRLILLQDAMKKNNTP